MARRYDWTFPLPRTHTGMVQGNGTFGAMIWGEGRILRITVGRADYWDHRGGLPWTKRQLYRRIRRCLEAGDREGLMKLFRRANPVDGEPARPSVLPIGRIEIDLGAGAKLATGTVDVDAGTVTVRVRKGSRLHVVRIVLDMGEPLLCVTFPSGLSPQAVRRVTSWDYVGEYLRSISFAEPEMFDGEGLAGWTQMRPADPHLAVAYRQSGRRLYLTAVYGGSAAGARQAAARVIDRAAGRGGDVAARSAGWWASYWRGAARVDLPNEKLRFLYDYGMYKFAGLTNPAGVAATLQGPWIEEYQMPPWQSDYHLNINVQMCYGPAYHGNRLEHLKPLWELIAGWMPVLRHNAKVFLGIDDGLMLPHAVDDRCTCMGGFWTGNIDHGCTAWIAAMMHRHWRYTMDRQFLRRTAYPFMAGAMRVYEAMLQRRGGRLVLPVSVSPEYRGAEMNAWGANASFQLACIHRLAEDLLSASRVLGERPRPFWKRIARELPKASLIAGRDGERIALWDGTDLEESHRHHSHLAGITPFDIFDFDDPFWWEVIRRSIRHYPPHRGGPVERLVRALGVHDPLAAGQRRRGRAVAGERSPIPLHRDWSLGAWASPTSARAVRSWSAPGGRTGASGRCG